MPSQDKAETGKNALPVIILAGLLVGSLDILSAFTDYFIATGKGPEGVLRFVASGAFGKDAFIQGREMAAWGLIFHFIIAYCWTALFYLLYTRTKLLPSNIILTSVLYGIVIWSVMNLLVLPLSNTPKSAFAPARAIKALLILIFMITLPLTIIMKKVFKQPGRQNGRI